MEDGATAPLSDPPWIAQAWGATLGEIKLFFATIVAFLRGPNRFGAEWGAGRVHALNPLAYALQALSIMGPYQLLAVRLIGATAPDGPLWAELIKPLVPFVYAVLFSLLAHAAVRLAGSRRPYRSTLAISLYTTGPMMVANLIFVPVAAVAYRNPNKLASGLLAMGGGLFMMAFYTVLCSSALAGLHGVKRRWPACAITLGFLLTFFFWAAVMRVAPHLSRALTF